MVWMDIQSDGKLNISEGKNCLVFSQLNKK